MALLTLTDGQTELQARGYSRFSTARLTVWLNSAKNRFEDYPYDWPWLRTSTTGTAPLTISDLRRVTSVADSTSKVPLSPVDVDAVIDYEYTDLTFAGQPAGWYLTSDTVLSTFPLGTQTLSVRYVKFSAELSSGSDAPLIPARYRSVWLDLAEVECLRFGAHDQQAAAALEAAVFARLAEIATVYTMQAQPPHMESLVTGESVDS